MLGVSRLRLLIRLVWAFSLFGGEWFVLQGLVSEIILCCYGTSDAIVDFAGMVVEVELVRIWMEKQLARKPERRLLWRWP